MAHALDRSLDEILAERKQTGRGGGGGNHRGNRGNAGRRRERPQGQHDYPRDGVRKSFRDRDDGPRNLDSEWVHDKFEDNAGRRSAPRRRNSPDYSGEPRGTKIRVDNIHYELTQEDLEGLFEKIGPVVKLDMKYDRAGRSEGTAYVTYESSDDARDAIKEYDGANAAGQPIRLTLMPSGPRRNAFDTAVLPSSGRPLADRITVPGGRSRSLSPRRASDDEAARRGVDRYRPGGPGGRRGSRSRSPLPNRRREAGRRPGARRERGSGRGERGGDRGERAPREGRAKKTQEELDAEMEDYFNGGSAQQGGAANNGAGGGEPQGDDIEMIE